jgi:hypothetical protein
MALLLQFAGARAWFSANAAIVSRPAKRFHEAFSDLSDCRSAAAHDLLYQPYNRHQYAAANTTSDDLLNDRANVQTT